MLLNPAALSDIKVNNFPILTENRLNLTRIYAVKHYGLKDVKLIDPKLIVIHYTVTETLSDALSLFKKDELKDTRPDIATGGELNVGVHFIIGNEGSIWNLLPVNIIGRHTIGYNHTSIGIELVGMSERSLTQSQLESCSALIAKLCSQFKTLEYLIGHHEYVKKNLPHFSLFKELDPYYLPAIKSDPGEKFMKRLRTLLKTRYNIALKK